MLIRADATTHPMPFARKDTSAPILWRVAERPGAALRFAIALLKGRYYVLACRLRGTRVVAGPRLRVFGRLKIQGPGQVVFGSNVVIRGTVTPRTYSENARIVIGDNVMMDGTRFGCVREIVVGPDCIVADARIMDSDFHSTRADRHSPAAPIRVAPIRIEENVWISASAALLPGTTVGRNSVVGFGAVCMGNYPADKVIIGNPARVAMPIPSTDGSVSSG